MCAVLVILEPQFTLLAKIRDLFLEVRLLSPDHVFLFRNEPGHLLLSQRLDSLRVIADGREISLRDLSVILG